MYYNSSNAHVYYSLLMCVLHRVLLGWGLTSTQLLALNRLVLVSNPTFNLLDVYIYLPHI
jgi:hypothetical protein